MNDSTFTTLCLKGATSGQRWAVSRLVVVPMGVSVIIIEGTVRGALLPPSSPRGK